MRRKALVAGALGMVGGHVAAHLSTCADWEVVGLSRGEPRRTVASPVGGAARLRSQRRKLSTGPCRSSPRARRARSACSAAGVSPPTGRRSPTTATWNGSPAAAAPAISARASAALSTSVPCAPQSRKKRWIGSRTAPRPTSSTRALRSACSSSAAGVCTRRSCTANQKVEPASGALLRPMCPPMRCTIWRAMVRPRPVPP